MLKDTERSVARTAAQIVVWAVLGVLIGAAIVISVLGWIAVGEESGGSCRNDACPNGSVLHFIAFFFAIVCWLPIVGAVALVGFRYTAAVTLVVALLVGGYLGDVLWKDVHGTTHEATWTAEPDRPTTLRGKGAWITGDLVVRARTDGAIAYRLTNGARAWAFEVPQPFVVCSVAETATQGVGLLAYGKEKESCDQVTAVDLTTGAELWKTTLDTQAKTDMIEMLGSSAGVALMPSARGLRGLDLRTGKPRWTWTAPKGCRFDPSVNGLNTSATTAAATLQCAAKTLMVNIETATGTSRWSTTLPTVGKVDWTSAISADPVVAYTQEPGERGRRQLVTFTAEGRVQAAFPTSTSGGDLQPYATGSLSVRFLTVQRNVILAAVENHDLVALDLNGKEIWRHETGDDIEALNVTAGSVGILGTRGLRNRATNLTVLDIPTGKVTEQAAYLHTFADEPFLMLSAPGHHVLIQSGSDPKTPPVTVFTR